VIKLKDETSILIKKHALKNAIEHDGKAVVNSVVAGVLGEKPKLKSQVKEIVKKVEEVVEEVNSLSLEEQKKKLAELGIEIEKPKVEKKELPPLPNAKIGKVVTAFPPEPSKYPHIGHAKAALINYLYAKKYKGKFICRMEDTNPEKCKEEYYEAMLDGLKWLGIKWDKLSYISDHIEKFYKATEKLIKNGKAYVCLCRQEVIKEKRRKMEECECRKQSIEKNLELWKKMLTTLKEGEATVRLKISMKHKNAAMRDPTIMRIVEYEHPRTGNKYRVWPTYDFGTALMDAWEGVTHRIRSKEFEMRTELQQFIQRALGYKSPWIDVFARFKIEDAVTSGRKIRSMISSGELLGWDDPRLVTLVALKKRGFLPEAIKEFLLETGISKAESVITWDVLESINRKHVDPIANRYFAVFDYVKISVKNAPEIKETYSLFHPDFPERGKRRIPVDTNCIYIQKNDFKKYRGKVIRLKDLFNVKLDKVSEYAGKELVKEMPKIHWVSEPNVLIKVVMPDASIEKALAEPEIEKLKVNDLIQLVRVGFCRVDKIKPEVVLYFTHS
jgi:glutamyl-tRNA synthetase